MGNLKKYFGTDGIRGRVGEMPIMPDFMLKLGWAVGRVLANGPNTKVLIGKDTRISGYMMESALEAGLSAAGVNIQLLGPMPTPAIAYLTRTLRAQAGIVISASHNPFYDNGVKFFSSEGKKLPDEIELAIEKQLELPMTMVASEKLGKASRVANAPGRYIEFCKNTIPPEISLQGFKIVVDCANGAAYKIAPTVLQELGAEVVELAVDPNGTNINDNCGATDTQMLQRVVVAENAHLGIALDGDGDRVIMVDHCGEILDGDQLLFIMAKQLFKDNRLQGGVVGTLMSNFGLEIALSNLGIEFARSKVGDRYVMAELLARNWKLGGESSGHIVSLDVTTTGDGIVSALQILAIMVQMGKSLHELKADMQKFPQTLINIKTVPGNRWEKQHAILSAIQKAEERLQGKGRVLLRSSGTEPLVRVMVEGEDIDLVNIIANELAEVVKSCA